MESLVQPFNILKAKILLPSDVSTETNQLQDIYKRNLELEKENIELKAQVEELKAYRIKWEGHLESLRAQSGVDTQKLPEKNKLAS